MPCYDCEDCDVENCCYCDEDFDDCECESNRGVIKAFVPKTPKSTQNHLGIEVEFLAPLQRDDIATKIEQAGLGDICQIKADGSVEDDDGSLCGHEMNILCTEANHKTVLRKVCRMFRDIGATVNTTCGLHVHLDMRKRDRQLVYSNLVGVQDILIQMQPRSRRSNNYCPINRDRSFENAARTYSRYAINATAYSKHRTIEVRLHSGTTNYRKITNWIAILLKVVGKRSVVPQVASVDEMTTILRLPPVLREYVEERIRAFNPADDSDTAVVA